MFEEEEKGSIEPGELADLVILSDNILTCSPEWIRSMDVLLTMVRGKVVYQHDGLSCGTGFQPVTDQGQDALAT
jgi:predicted amidohydrolase YtcJ